MKPPAICLSNVFLSLQSSSGKVQILDDINLQIEEEEAVALVGPSGSCKSSLMMLNEMNHKIADDVRISKSKDDIRGPKIIDGYESAHESAEDDSVVKLVREDCANMSVMISKYMSNL